jgi:hypothetical protein
VTTPLVAVTADKRVRGLSTTNREVTLAYQVMPLAEALATSWSTDAHCVTYVGAPVGEWQPRINKDGLVLYPDPVTCNVLLADVDNPGHGDWTDELLASAELDRLDKPVLATTGWYLTKHGYRLVQPLAAPIPVTAVEDVLRRWLADLAAAGVDVDPGCRDWTRHFRMPHVVREVAGPSDAWGVPTNAQLPYRSPRVDLDDMRPITITPLVAPAATRGPRVQRDGQSPFFRAAETAGWVGRARGGGYWTMTCPWEHEHTTPGGTAVYERGGPVCAHAHCATRTFRDWLSALPPDARRLYEELTDAELRHAAEVARAAAQSRLRKFWGGGK